MWGRTSVLKAFLLYYFVTFGFGRIDSSRISIADGLYNNILFALHPDTNSTDCIGLLQNITESLKFTSAQLSTATNRRVSFGTVKILIPPTWGTGMPDCVNLPAKDVTPAELYDLYDTADIKLSSTHPFAKALPWTKQYKGCENESDSIYVPLGFFKNGDFDSETRGRILLAEWIKFRYGVFEEHGYYGDPVFPSCYSFNQEIFYTGCTSSPLNPLSNISSDGVLEPEGCDTLVGKNLENLKDQLKNKRASLLLAPYLQNMEAFCTREYQIGVSPTRQNVLCERRSVSDVVFAHRDFKMAGSMDTEFFPNTRGGPRPGSINTDPQISFIRRDGNYDQGYAFILEDDESIREYGRIQQVKQSIAQILQLIKPRTQVAVLRFQGSDHSQFFRKVNDDTDRIQILNKIPEPSSLPLSQYITSRYSGSARSSRIHFPNTRIKKRTSFLRILKILAAYQSEQWHLIMISSSPPEDLVDTLPEFQKSSHSFSVLTYDESKEWLQFNTIPNTHKVIHLPSCSDQSPCQAGETTSLFVDYFTEILATNSSVLRHFTNKIVDFTFTGEAEHNFTISSDRVENLQNFQLYLPIYSAEAGVHVTSPNGKLCPVNKLLNYDYVLSFDTSPGIGCPYEAGNWRIRVTLRDDGVEPHAYTLYGVGETAGDENDIVTTVSLGRPLYSEVFPTLGALPAYVSVSTVNEHPVLDAEVSLRIHSQQNQSNKIIFLQDQGMDPDLVANDGVYSAFVTTFNPFASFHTGRVSVRTQKGVSKSIESLNFLGPSGSGAALPDSRMISKCCGSEIPVDKTAAVRTYSYSILLPSFQTGEDINPDIDILPPSRIGRIRMSEDGLNSSVLEFTAPGSDFSDGTVAAYDICCTNSSAGNLDDSMCTRILNSSSSLCAPVAGGRHQRCTVSKSHLLYKFYNAYTDSSSMASPLLCSLRGVDDSGNVGPLSFTLMDIRIDAKLLSEGLKAECKRVSDGCLPVNIFWALIGIIGGLVFIVFTVLLCWCCLTWQEQRESKRKANAVKSTGWSRSKNWIEGLSNENLSNVYINQAYIQDSNGQLKLVASDGVLFPLEEARELPGIRRRSLHDTTKPSEDKDKKHISWNNGEEEKEESQPPTPTRTFPPPPPPSVRSANLATSFNAPSSAHSSSLQLPRIGVSTSERSIQSISSSVDAAEDSGPVYASVSRFGRKNITNNPSHTSPQCKISYTNPRNNYQPNLSVRNIEINDPPSYPLSYSSASTFQSPRSSHQSVENSRAVSPVKPAPTAAPLKPPVIIAPPFRGINDTALASNTIHPLPPVRLDHFPSSESEAYSDLSQIIKTPGQETDVRINRRVDTKLRPVSSPPPEMTLSVINLPPKSPQIYRSMDIQRPAAFPPPPPRLNIEPVDHRPIGTFPKGAKKLVTRRSTTEAEDAFYDDDSDNWDNYDEDVSLHLKYNPGTSYA